MLQRIKYVRYRSRHTSAMHDSCHNLKFLSHGLTCSVGELIQTYAGAKQKQADNLHLEPSLQSFFWLASFLYQRLQLLLVRQNLQETKKKRYVVMLAANVLIVPVLPLLDFLL